MSDICRSTPVLCLVAGRGSNEASIATIGQASDPPVPPPQTPPEVPDPSQPVPIEEPPMPIPIPPNQPPEPLRA
jgi:hypothetical protein